jgi:hypothetical protein
MAKGGLGGPTKGGGKGAKLGKNPKGGALITTPARQTIARGK